MFCPLDITRWSWLQAVTICTKWCSTLFSPETTTPATWSWKSRPITTVFHLLQTAIGLEMPHCVARPLYLAPETGWGRARYWLLSLVRTTIVLTVVCAVATVVTSSTLVYSDSSFSAYWEDGLLTGDKMSCQKKGEYIQVTSSKHQSRYCEI
jgi:hypothetical protein